MNCPHCKSPDTRKFSVIYESGTSFGGITGVGVGISDFDLSGGLFASNTGTQTMLAARVAPPKVRYIPFGLFLFMVFSGLGLFLAVYFIVIYGLSLTTVSIGVVAGFLALCAASLNSAHRSELAEFPARKSRWEKSWLCMRCGKDFLV